MLDRMGRTIDYIRISITDRCNLRCRYCMPEDGISLMDHKDLLSFEEILQICRSGADLGIHKVKVTGGEPLVRLGVAELIGELMDIDGIDDVTMTSNGCLLGNLSKELKDAGLSCVNVSLDTLCPEKFAKITRRDCFDQVMDGIERGLAAGLRIKVNCAVMEDLTAEEVLRFAEYSMDKGIPVRFIEMMPIGQGRAYHALDNRKLLEIISGRYQDLTLAAKVKGNGPAVYYEYADSKGCVGFISAVHHKFCDSCNRVRLTSNGFLKLCLASPEGIDLRTSLRAGITDTELTELMRTQIGGKPESHHFEQMLHGVREETDWNMNQIGG